MLDKESQRIQAEIDKAEAKLEKALREQKALQYKKNELKRKARTHMLCTIGGALEPYLQEASLLTEADLKTILDTAFNSAVVRQRINTLLDARRGVIVPSRDTTETTE